MSFKVLKHNTSQTSNMSKQSTFDDSLVKKFENMKFVLIKVKIMRNFEMEIERKWEEFVGVEWEKLDRNWILEL